MRAKKVILAELFARCGITRLFQKHSRPGLIIINYHRLKENDIATDFCEEIYGPNIGLFEKQMRWLAENTDVLSEDDLVDFVNGEKPFSRRGVIVTFDDGYIDNYTLAYPLLKVLNLPAIFFISTSLIEERHLGWWDIIDYMIKRSGKNSIRFKGEKIQIESNEEKKDAANTLRTHICNTADCDPKLVLDNLSFETDVDYPSLKSQDKELMTWEQINEVEMNGIRIGSHTHTHKILSTLDIGEQMTEMEISKRVLEENLRTTIKSIAYPFSGSLIFALLIIDNVISAK